MWLTFYCCFSLWRLFSHLFAHVILVNQLTDLYKKQVYENRFPSVFDVMWCDVLPLCVCVSSKFLGFSCWLISGHVKYYQCTYFFVRNWNVWNSSCSKNVVLVVVSISTPFYMASYRLCTLFRIVFVVVFCVFISINSVPARKKKKQTEKAKPNQIYRFRNKTSYLSSFLWVWVWVCVYKYECVNLFA